MWEINFYSQSSSALPFYTMSCVAPVS